MASASGSSVPPSLSNKPIRIGKDTLAYVVVNEEQWEIALAKLRDSVDDSGAVGLDIEYVPVSCADSVKSSTPSDSATDSSAAEVQRRTNVKLGKLPLLQLGTPKLAILIRLCFFSTAPTSLREFLDRRDLIFVSLQSVYEVGVDISEDAQRLRAHWNLRIRHFLDLRFICVNSMRFSDAYPSGKLNLKSLGAHLGQDIGASSSTDVKSGKGTSTPARQWQLACSNWTASTLTKKQIEYAAKDAIAASGSYIALVNDYMEHPDYLETGTPELYCYAFNAFRKYFNRIWSDVNLEKTKSTKSEKYKPVLDGDDLDNKMKKKAFKKLAEARNCSDSGLDFDWEEKVREMVNEMRVQPSPPVTYIYREGASKDEKPCLFVETELLDWLEKNKAEQVRMSGWTKIGGLDHRVGMIMELIEDDE